MKTDDVNFRKLEKITIEQMRFALEKILILGASEHDLGTQTESGDNGRLNGFFADKFLRGVSDEKHETSTSSNEKVAKAQADKPAVSGSTMICPPSAKELNKAAEQAQSQLLWVQDAQRDGRGDDGRVKGKAMTFDLKQIMSKNGTIRLNDLDRLFEVTHIGATDVETGHTLLEHACRMPRKGGPCGDLGLAKVCYRRGANLSAVTHTMETPFNIATGLAKHDMMEFLFTYGVKVNSCDPKGVTALHVATANNDIDSICRLVEWGADVNMRDQKKKTPLHYAAFHGHMEVFLFR